MLVARLSRPLTHLSVAAIMAFRTGGFPSPPASGRPSAHPHTRPTAPHTPPPGLRGGAGSGPLRSASYTHGRRAHLAARPESAPPISTPTRGPCASQSSGDLGSSSPLGARRNRVGRIPSARGTGPRG